VKVSLVLTFIGRDRTGGVERLSQTVLDHGANWEESRMARLASRFAGILQVTVDTGSADALTSALLAHGEDGFQIVVERHEEGDSEDAERSVRLEVVGRDRQGIVHDIARSVAQLGVNVEELSSAFTGAPWSGDPVFKVQADLRVPSGLDVDDVRSALEALAADLMVDLSDIDPNT